MRVLIRAFTVAVLVVAALTRSEAFAAIKVVTTTEDLASLAREVGGDKVQVDALAKGYQDPHFVDPKPSFILQVSRADLLDRRRARARDRLAAAAHHAAAGTPRFSRARAGYLDASQNVKILEIPTGQITRAMGDVHPSGNPHYWLDPDNGRKIAQSIRDKLSELSPNDKAYFAQRYADFDKRLAEAEKRWDATMAPYKGTKLVTYHRSWPNFMERFGLERHRLRRAEAGHPAVAVAHARADRRDEEPGREAHRRRAVLRPEDAAGDREPGRRQGAGAGAVGRRHEGSHRLHPAVRLRRQPAGVDAQADHRQSSAAWTGRFFNSSRRRSSRA